MRMQRLIHKAGYLAGSGLLLSLFSAPSLFGQEPDLRVTVFSGGSFVKADHTFLIAGDGFRTKYASGGKLGFRVTGNMDKHWSAEGSYSYGTDNLRVFDFTAGTERAFGVRVNQLTGNVLYYFSAPSEKLRPFLTGGVGYARFGPTDDARAFAIAREFLDGPAAISASNKGVLLAGAGIEGKFNDKWGFRADLRDLMTGTPRYGLSKTGPGPIYPASGIAHGLEASVGVVFHLGR